MGKKAKKKARSGHKDKRISSPSSKPVSHQKCNNNVENVQDIVAIAKNRRACPHIDKGVNLDKLSGKLGSSEAVKCEDCRANILERRANKTKGKQGQNAGKGSNLNAKAIWICLECGHFSCGGAGLPTTPQSHAVRHARQHHHPLAVHYENPHLRWCFPCNSLVPAENSEENGQVKDVLQDIVKMIRQRPSEGSIVDVEDVWFGSGSLTSVVKSEHSVLFGSDGKCSYSVKGLVNLGNTCFFNSVMQNLLAIDKLRDYFSKLSEPAGPLTAALRKLFVETNPEAALKSVINPRSLFGSICTKAPQFRGYQQHDSHELLRTLLDGLCTEEMTARKQTKSSQSDSKSPDTDPTFIDTIFGGKLSSTVSCLECRHPSTVYEPFLDLSLPIPSKKPRPQRTQPLSRGKKPKLPPKRNGRNKAKASRALCTFPSQNASDISNGNYSGGVNSSVLPAEQSAVSSCDSVDASTIAGDMGLILQDLSAAQNPEQKQSEDNFGDVSASPDGFAWLDYLDPSPESNDIDTTAEAANNSGDPFSSNRNTLCSFPNTLDLRIKNDLIIGASAPAFANLIQDGSLEQGIAAGEGNVLPENSETKENAEEAADMECNSGSCNQVFSESSNFELSSSGKDEQTASQVQESEVLLLPYREEHLSTADISTEAIEVTSAANGEEDTMEFDGFGNLFNEPEADMGTRPSASVGNDAVKNGFLVGNISDSDPDEIDNTDAPVSVESCLAYFTKPELLSKDEHAWQCENCSKILQEKRIASAKLQKALSQIYINGDEDGNQSNGLFQGKSCPDVINIYGNAERDLDDTFDDILEFQNGKTESHLLDNTNSVAYQLEDREPDVTSACPLQSKSSTMSCLCDSCSRHEHASDGPYTASDSSETTGLLAASCEAEVSDREGTELEKLKVKRDATKRILINKVPSILTIHLKRFSQDARGRLSKLGGHVNFKEIIDLKPFMDPRCVEKDMYLYRLVGVVEHLGTMRGGHYVAYVRGGKRSGKAEKENGNCVWYHASDAYVREASLDEVLRCEAYILFYEET